MFGLKEDLPIDGIEKFSIDRQELWEDSIAAFKNPKFKDSFRLRVRFLGLLMPTYLKESKPENCQYTTSMAFSQIYTIWLERWWLISLFIWILASQC